MGGSGPHNRTPPRPSGLHWDLLGLPGHRYGLRGRWLFRLLGGRDPTAQRENRTAVTVQDLQHAPMPGFQLSGPLVEPEIVACHTVRPTGSAVQPGIADLGPVEHYGADEVFPGQIRLVFRF